MTCQEFRAARLTLGLTQQELGQIMGMAQGHVARIEGARQPTRKDAATMRILLAAHKIGFFPLLIEVLANTRK